MMIEEQITPIRPGKVINYLIQSQVTRVLLGEFIATAFLMFVATSVGTLPPYEGHPQDSNKYRLVYVVILVYVIVCFFGPITGAHINPAVSLTAHLNKQRRRKHIGVLISYWIGQFAGGFVGVVLSRNIYGNGAAVFQTMPEVFELGKLCLQQLVATFMLLFFILLVTDEETTFVEDEAWVHLTIGIVYYFCLTLSSELHFLNPAVVTSLQFQAMLQGNTSSEALPAIFVIIVFQFLGGILSYVLFKKVYRPRLQRWRSKLMQQ